MADQKPLILVAGQVQQIPVGDTVPVTSGGTGAVTAAQALLNLGGSSLNQAYVFAARHG